MSELEATPGVVRSIRTDGDSWDITESVGATALGVAASRASETAQPDALIHDDFAYLLVSSAGPAWAMLASPDPDWFDDPDARRAHLMARNYQAVRTHFFDEYFTTAMRDDVRQVVILASGLDSRAYRLEWRANTVVFEIDQPKVLAYKSETLQAHGAVPKARRHPVPVDLRDDWPAALLATGFDPTTATAWLAEGLLPYLPGEAQDRLFDRITELSAVGSHVAVEALRLDNADATPRRAAWRARTAQMRSRLGLDLNVEALTYREPDRPDAARSLQHHGWQVDIVDSVDEMARLGRPVPADMAEEAMNSELLRARLGP
jgi:methyltransferase (TIGR00027 family)